MLEKFKKAIIMLTIVLFVFLIGVIIFLVRTQTEQAYVSDIYVVNDYLILEGYQIENIYLQGNQEDFVFSKADGAAQYNIHTEYLETDAYYLLPNKKTKLALGESVVDRQISFNHKTFKIVNLNGIYALMKEKDNPIHPDYENTITNELQENYELSDFLIQDDNEVYISITAHIDTDVYIGFSSDKTNFIYNYEVIEQQGYLQYKKIIYKVFIPKEALKETRLYVRVLPKGTEKNQIKSKQLLLKDLLDISKPIDATENNIKVV